MNRLHLIQTLMRQKGLRNYLEIGVENGGNFFRVNSRFKVAVDPNFTFDAGRRIGKTLLNPYNFYNQYFEKTSDAFFEQDASRVFSRQKLHIALVDGMHEYQFVRRDVDNSLRYLDEKGVIILHDCNPQTAEAAGRFADWKTGEWNGDVWKTVVYLRSQRPDLNVFVLDCDQGLGIVTRGKPESTLSFTLDQIASLTYEALAQNRASWLNLKPAEYAYAYFGLSRPALHP